MSKVTHITQRKFTIELTEAEAYIIKILTGQCNGALYDLYSDLDDLNVRNVDDVVIDTHGTITIEREGS